MSSFAAEAKGEDATSPSAAPEIDEALYSRQLYTLGKKAMLRMQETNVLISGLNGAGVEAAKNIILAGVKSVVLHDDAVSGLDDLSSNFYVTEADVAAGRTRCAACLPKLRELNDHVAVNGGDASVLEATAAGLGRFTVVVAVNFPRARLLEVSAFCRANGICFIATGAYGLYCYAFSDFGESWDVFDVDGENPAQGMVTNITKGPEGVVYVDPDEPTDIDDDAHVVFEKIEGMEELNELDRSNGAWAAGEEVEEDPVTKARLKPGRVDTDAAGAVVGIPHKVKRVKVKDGEGNDKYGYAFSVGDTSKFGDYIRGGYFTQVKKIQIMNFKSLASLLDYPAPPAPPAPPAAGEAEDGKDGKDGTEVEGAPDLSLPFEPTNFIDFGRYDHTFRHCSLHVYLPCHPPIKTRITPPPVEHSVVLPWFQMIVNHTTPTPHSTYTHIRYTRAAIAPKRCTR